MTTRFSLGAALLFVCTGCGAARTPVGPTSPAGALDPLQKQSAEQLYQKGRESAERGDTVRAEQYLELALDKGYDRRRVLPVLLGVCLSSGRLRSALNYAEPELRERPDDAELRYLVAAVHLGLGQQDEARGELEQLLRMAPGDPAALYLLGVIESDDFAEPELARRHFEAYLIAAPRGKHAAEVRDRLGALQVRRAASSDTDSVATEGNCMPRYEPYVPSPGVLTEPPRLNVPAALTQTNEPESGWQ